MGKIHKNSFPSINYTQHEIFWNKIFRIRVNSCYEYNVLLLTLKKKVEEIRCIWNILYIPDAATSMEFFSLYMLSY